MSSEPSARRTAPACWTTTSPRAGEVTAANAWQHVYRLLLWADQTTGLAHCYESDKCQPGRPWYARSLAFHAWVSEALGSSPAGLAEDIDLMFRWVTADLAVSVAAGRAAAAKRQRQPYAGQGFPEPGMGTGLEAIITETLGPYLQATPPAEILHQLGQRIHAYISQENKRKNLLGEGFEDTFAAILRGVPGISRAYDIRVRSFLQYLPGFYRTRGDEKPKQVDVALIRRSDGYRTLLTCKWSVRSDREEQFLSDYDAYVRLEAAGQDFGHVLVTNEFDPARLAAACDNRRGNAPLFTSVVHVNPDGLRAAYAAPAGRSRRGGGMERTLAHLDSGRLSGLASWLSALTAPAAR